jgi:hypothetical protein
VRVGLCVIVDVHDDLVARVNCGKVAHPGT